MSLEESGAQAVARGGTVGAFVRCMRPAQWVKNLIVFAGIIFAQRLFMEGMFLRSVLAFVVFCGLAGAQYVINDLKDIESDRRHPEKCLRPLASGQLRPDAAWVGALCVTGGATVLAFYLGTAFGALAVMYFLLVVTYSYILKHKAILDVFAIAIGFVLRAAAGAVVVGVGISSWLLICALFLALFLALSKRRHEIMLLGSDATAHRRSLEEYSPQFLDQMIAVVTSSTVISYALFTVSTDTLEYQKYQTHWLVYTVPFVLYGIFRYLYIVFRRDQGGNPTSVLLRDRSIQITVGAWLLTCGCIMYRSLLGL